MNKKVAAAANFWIKYGRNIGLVLAGLGYLFYAFTVITKGELPDGLFVLFCLIVLYIFNLERKLNKAEDHIEALLMVNITSVKIITRMEKDLKAVNHDKLPKDVRNEIALEVFKQVKDDVVNIAKDMATTIRTSLTAKDEVAATEKTEPKAESIAPDKSMRTNFMIWRK